MPLPVTGSMEDKLEAAADQGLDLAFVAVIDWGGIVGKRYYSSRGLSFGNPDAKEWEVRLEVLPITRRNDMSAVRFDALNDDLTLILKSIPEDADGAEDPNRLQKLLATVPGLNAQVSVGVVDVRGASYSDIKWDGVYKVDDVTSTTKEVRLQCVDRLLQPGEKTIGKSITNADFPVAPTSSYSMVRGPVFGKVDSLPLVPVEVGMTATLAQEIDEQDGVLEIEAEEISLWPSSGFVQVGEEIIFYRSIDKANKRLGSVSSPCSRGTGFPETVITSHGAGVVVREVFTGRAGLLNVAMTTASTSIELLAVDEFPAQGIVVIEDEAIYYFTRSGSTLTNLMRGVPVPTMARVHGAGTMVRTFPTGPDGKARYRYVVAQGAVDAVSNLRVVSDEDNRSEMPYTGRPAVLSQIVTESGETWSVVDLPDRPQYQRYESSGSRIDQEWICETSGEVDGEGVALPASFFRWRPGAGLSPEHFSTWPRAVDPNASTRAVILEAAPGKNVFSVEFDARWDEHVNNPKRRFGRFRNARVHVKVQYDRATDILAQYQVYTNGLMTKSGVLQPPSMAAGGDGSITGSQELPRSRWDTQPQVKEVRLASRTTQSISVANSAYWVNPKSGYRTDATYDHNTITSGDIREFLSGGWRFPISPGSSWIGGSSAPFKREIWDGELTGWDAGPLYLYSVGTFPAPDSTDSLTRLVLTIHNPTGQGMVIPPSGPAVPWNDWVRTGWTGDITIYSNPDYTGESRTFPIAIGRTEDVVRPNLPLEGLKWSDCQSIRLKINQWRPAAGGEGALGVSVGQIFLAVEYVPDVEGQRVGTLVDGSYFRTTDSTAPSRIFDQVISLGATAKEAARTYGVDPWLFFSNVLGEGMRFVVSLPESGDGLQFAVADIQLELEYDAATVVYDGVVRADVDGRVGVPVGGGSPRVLENATDVLAYLVDEDEFYGMAGERDSASWLDARELTELAGWRVARAITESISVRELASSLAGESRQWLLADGLLLYCRPKFEEVSPSESVRTVGDQANPAYRLVSDDVQVVQRIQDIANSLGCYYRRNYLTGDYRAIIEAKDDSSIELYGLRRVTPNLDWHQSARGYAGGLMEQRERLHWLTDYMLTVSARRWDYVTLQLPPSAVEDLQRCDIITLNRPRSGYVDAVGRVVSLQRMAGPVRWQVTAQMSGMSAGDEDSYIWISPDEQSFIRLAESGARMDFVVSSYLAAQLRSNGDLRLRGSLTHIYGGNAGGSPWGGNNEVSLRRARISGSSLVYEWLLTLTNIGNVVRLYSYNASLGGASVMRNTITNVTMPNLTGPNGIVDTGKDTGLGRLEFYLANRLVMFIDNAAMHLKGNLVADLGDRMGKA